MSSRYALVSIIRTILADDRSRFHLQSGSWLTISYQFIASRPAAFRNVKSTSLMCLAYSRRSCLLIVEAIYRYYTHYQSRRQTIRPTAFLNTDLIQNQSHVGTNKQRKKRRSTGIRIASNTRFPLHALILPDGRLRSTHTGCGWSGTTDTANDAIFTAGSRLFREEFQAIPRQAARQPHCRPDRSRMDGPSQHTAGGETLGICPDGLVIRFVHPAYAKPGISGDARPAGDSFDFLYMAHTSARLCF